MNLNDFFSQTIATFGPRLAVEMRPRYRTIRWTYETLGRQTCRMAQRLADEGINRGDRVLLFSGNSPLWIAGFFGILSRGAVVVPLNPQSTPEQLNRIIASAEPKLLLKSARLPWTGQDIKTINLQDVMEAPFSKNENALFVSEPVSATDLAEIVYTSGTTGEPKGVMLTHANLLSNLAALSQTIPMKETDHLVSIIPLFHMYGQMTSMLYPLKHGAAVTYLPSLGSKLILETFRYTPATHLAAVPEFLKTIMDRLEMRLANEAHLKGILRIPFVQHLPLGIRKVLFKPIRNRISSSLHTISSGGAPLEPELEKRWRTLGFDVLQGYGLTETSPIIAINTRTQARVGTVGKPVPGMQIKISKDGELLVKGPNVMAGYYKDEKRTAAVFEDGWFKTDDGAKLDEDGFISIFGRKKYMIVGAGGEKVFPEDIEEELNKHPAVKDSAVVGVKKDGRVVIHAVLLSNNDDVREAVEEANSHLASHQQILAWSVWPEADFPRSATRKVKKEEIISWLANQTDHAVAPKHDDITPFTRLVAQVTKHDPRTITSETKLTSDLKLDSLLRIELVSQIEEEFGVDVEEKSITQKSTVGDLERIVLSSRGTPPRIVEFPRWSARPVFCALRSFLQRTLVFSWLRTFVRLEIEGTENLKNVEGPFMFMPNHVSYIDPAVLLQALSPAIRNQLGIAAAVDVLYTRFRIFSPLADLVFNSYPFPTEANENIKPGLEYTGRLLDNGFHVMIFPEGQVNRNPKQHMNHLKAGAGVLACEMDATVVPMAIIGLEKLMKPGQVLPRGRGTVTIRFGKPVRFRYTDSYPAATKKLEGAISRLILK